MDYFKTLLIPDRDLLQLASKCEWRLVLVQNRELLVAADVPGVKVSALAPINALVPFFDDIHKRTFNYF